mmetsp:Transcript_17000/g.27110  ORF Transcript_17000/g.27110 Transcript_17000/m.27110 type:complete len:252 (-) Transcript_17000:188-943(-)
MQDEALLEELITAIRGNIVDISVTEIGDSKKYSFKLQNAAMNGIASGAVKLKLSVETASQSAPQKAAPLKAAGKLEAKPQPQSPAEPEPEPEPEDEPEDEPEEEAPAEDEAEAEAEAEVEPEEQEQEKEEEEQAQQDEPEEEAPQEEEAAGDAEENNQEENKEEENLDKIGDISEDVVVEYLKEHYKASASNIMSPHDIAVKMMESQGVQETQFQFHLNQVGRITYWIVNAIPEAFGDCEVAGEGFKIASA